MDVSVIILTYNSSSYIEVLLSGLIDTYKDALENSAMEIILVDNNSSDDTVTKAGKHKEVRVIKNRENYGFAKGINEGAKKARGEVLVLINPDSKIIGGDIFEMVGEFGDEKTGVVGGKIVNASSGPELSCGKTYTWLNILLLSLGLEKEFGVRFSPASRRQVDFVSGAFLAVRKKLYDRLNGLDEHYFMYVEDADLCFRVKKEGYKVFFSTAATIQHAGQGSSNRTFAIINIYKGLSYFQKKHMSETSHRISMFFLKLKACALVMYGKISNNYYLVSTYEEAFKAVS